MKVRFESNEQLPVALERITSAAAIPAAQPARRPYAPPPQATAPPRPPEELKENPF